MGTGGGNRGAKRDLAARHAAAGAGNHRLAHEIGTWIGTCRGVGENGAMIAFLATGWLWAAGVTAVLGAWGLLAGRARRMRVSAVWLWRGLEGQGVQGRRRVDPVWACVGVAALLAALALARPVWRVGVPVDRVEPQWAVRSIAGRTEAWIHVAGGEEVLVDGKPQAVAAGGAALELPAGDVHVLAIERGGQVAARSTFRRPMAGAFQLLQVGRVDPALLRVFAVQAGTPAAESQRVLLASGAGFSLEQARGVRLTVVAGAAALEGVTVDGMAEGAWTPEAVDVPAFVNFSEVHVRRMAKATLSPEWHVTVRANGLPWVAERSTGENGERVVWLASHPDGAETDWPSDRSFVLYFSELLRRTIPAGGAGSVVDWPRQEDPPPAPVREVALLPGLGVAVAALLAAAMVLLWRRAL